MSGGQRGRRKGAPRTMVCQECGAKELTMRGWPFRCEPCKPAKTVGTGPILKAERKQIRQAAHALVARAVYDGTLPPAGASICVDCGELPASEYDHRDYTQPLKVDPVCRGCNVKRGPALVWTVDGRLPVDGRVLRHLSFEAMAAVLAGMTSKPTTEAA